MLDELFYIVCMNTKNNKQLYIKEGYKNAYEWTFDYNECIWFETLDSARDFAKSYFKNFNKWYVSALHYTGKDLERGV